MSERFSLWITGFTRPVSKEAALRYIFEGAAKAEANAIDQLPFRAYSHLTVEHANRFAEDLRSLGVYVKLERESASPAPSECAAPAEKRSFDRRVVAVFALILAAGVGSGVLLRPTKREVGRLEDVSGKALLRSVPARTGDSLYPGDRIRTEKASSVRLRLISGNRITAGSESEFELFESNSSEDRVRLIRGDLESEASTLVEIETPSVIARVRPPRDGAGRLKVSVDPSRTDTRIAVQAGAIDLLDRSRQKELLTDYQSATPIDIHPDTPVYLIEVIRPKIAETVRATDGPFIFEWKSPPSQGGYDFELSLTKEFASPLLSVTTERSSVQVEYLEKGQLYWRVRERNGSVWSVPLPISVE